MTVLESFYLLFKTDAKGAAGDIAALEKQIESLSAKGKKRSDDETKALKEAIKQHKLLSTELKEQQKQVDKIGESYVKVIEGAVGAITAFASFSAIKSGLTSAKDFNSSLEIQSKVLRQNSQDLLTWATAVKSAGGDSQSFLNYITSVYGRAAEAHIQLPPVDQYLRGIRERIKPLAPQDQYFRLQQEGITDLATISLLEEKNDAIFEKRLAAAKASAIVDERALETSRQFNEQWSLLSSAGQRFYSIVGTEIYPVLTRMAKAATDFLEGVNKSGDSVNVLFSALVGIAGAGFIATLAGIRGLLFGIGGAAGASATGVGLLGEGMAALFARLVVLPAVIIDIGRAIASIIDPRVGGGVIVDAAQGLSDHIIRENDKITGSSPGDAYKAAAARHAPQKRSESQIGAASASVAFWVSQGYTPAQAAGIAANEIAESGGRANPGQNSFNAGHYGLYQWDETRRASILAGTGIDVATASADDQRRAAAWELRQRGDDTRIKNAASAGDSAAIVNRYFERSGEDPAQRAALAIQIAQQHLTTASQTPASFSTITSAPSSSSSVSIGDVAIHTQATDAQGIAREFRSALQDQIRPAISNFDDGRSM